MSWNGKSLFAELTRISTVIDEVPQTTKGEWSKWILRAPLKLSLILENKLSSLLYFQSGKLLLNVPNLIILVLIYYFNHLI